MKRGLILLLGFLVMGVFSSAALAQTRTTAVPSTGYIEICKQSAPAPLSVTGNPAPFQFTITDSANGKYYATLTAGLCSQPIQVAAGWATVVETQAPDGWFSVASITEPPGSSNLGPVDLTTGTAHVNVPVSSDFSGTATLIYTNKLDPGVLEICKKAEPGSGLTGSYSFTITGHDGFTASATAQVGSCAPPITVPSGAVTVHETGTVSVTDISAMSGGSSIPVVADLTAGTGTVNVQAGDVSNQTIVTFTDNVTTLKLCKAWDANTPPVSYPFSFGVTGPAGPNGPTAPISLLAGSVASPNCVVVGQYRAGTLVTITEGVVPGTKVEYIDANPAGNIVPGSENIYTRTVTIDMGPGETVVTYTNMPADPGQLKICKDAGSPAPFGSAFVFTIGSKTVTVPVGQCVVVPGNFPFMSTQTIVETLAGDTVSAIAVLPSFVTQGGVLTTTPVLVGAPDLATGTVSVLIGEDTITEVTYTNVDPPAVVVPPAVVPPTGGSSSGGSSGGGGSSSPSTPAPAVTPPAAPASVPPVAKPTVVKAKLVFANLATSKLGKYLQVRVTGPNATAKIKITLLGKNGKVLKVVTKTVPANKLVRVAGLTISKATVAARVTVVQ